MARPFSARALRFTGPSAPVAQSVGEYAGASYGYFCVSPSGVLAYQTVTATADDEMTWFSRKGQKLGTVGQPDIYSFPALSPDGTRLAATVGDTHEGDIWIYDLERGTGSRLTFNPADDLNPVWSADGSQIFFSSNRSGQYDIYQQAADGLGGTLTDYQSKGQYKYINDISADGRYAVYDTGGSANVTELWALPLFGDRKPFPFVQGGFGATSAQFSPNGRFAAYASNETGRKTGSRCTSPLAPGKSAIRTQRNSRAHSGHAPNRAARQQGRSGLQIHADTLGKTDPLPRAPRTGTVEQPGREFDEASGPWPIQLDPYRQLTGWTARCRHTAFGHPVDKQDRRRRPSDGD